MQKTKRFKGIEHASGWPEPYMNTVYLDNSLPGYLVLVVCIWFQPTLHKQLGNLPARLESGKVLCHRKRKDFPSQTQEIK
jgi:hypothetical protein